MIDAYTAMACTCLAVAAYAAMSAKLRFRPDYSDAGLYTIIGALVFVLSRMPA